VYGQPCGKCEYIQHGAIAGAPPVAGENSTADLPSIVGENSIAGHKITGHPIAGHQITGHLIAGHPIAGAEMKKKFSRTLGSQKKKSNNFRRALTVQSLVLTTKLIIYFFPYKPHNKK